MDEDSDQYESNTNNDPEYDIDHASNKINTMGEERREDGGTVERTKQQNNTSHIENMEEEHNKNSAEFERTFYDYEYNMWRCDDRISTTEKMNNVCFTQMSAKRGINTIGEKAVVAIVEEYQQLDSLGVFVPIPYDQLNRTQRSGVLNAINLIKQKRCGKIKERTVADGQKQRDLYAKSETSSPTLSLEGFTTLLMIDVAEGRSVAIADVAGAFLKADMDDFVVVKLQGPAVEALVQINKKKYHRYITEKGRNKIWYLRLLKAMYGTLKAPILWYSLFANTLKEN